MTVKKGTKKQNRKERLQKMKQTKIEKTKNRLISVSSELSKDMNLNKEAELYLENLKEENDNLRSQLKAKKVTEKDAEKEEETPILYDVEFASGLYCRTINFKIQVDVKVSPDSEDGEKTILALFEKSMLEFSSAKDGNFLNVIKVGLDKQAQKASEKRLKAEKAKKAREEMESEEAGRKWKEENKNEEWDGGGFN